MIMKDKDRSKVDIILVNMPQAPLHAPPIALGLLQAALKRDNTITKSIFANLKFLEFIGPQEYARLNSFKTSAQVFDWLFAGEAFPGFRSDEDRYLELILKRNLVRGETSSLEIKRVLSNLRKRIPQFLGQTVDQVLLYRPRIVGCTSSFQQHAAAIALLRKIREADPSITTLLGGPNCEAIMGLTTHKNFPWIDYVVSGEADELISPLCRDIFAYGRNLPKSKTPYGLFTPIHRDEGYPGSGFDKDSYRAAVSSLEELPLPDYDDYFEEFQRFSLKNLICPTISYEMSRGCWWGRCRFCGLNGCRKSYKAKSPDKIIKELSQLSQRYHFSKFALVDNIFHYEFFSSLLPKLESLNAGFRFFVEIKSNLTRKQIIQLKKVGMTYLNPGIESLHSKVLQLIKKGVEAWQNIMLLKWCRQYGITAGSNIIVGFPGEKDEWYREMADTIPLLAHLYPCSIIHLNYCRFSKYFTQQHRYGLKLKPPEPAGFIFPLQTDELAHLVYHFENETGSADMIHLEEKKFTGRPGLETLLKETARWRMDWSPGRPRLSIRKYDNSYVIEDTRPCAAAPVHYIEGIHKKILDSCEATPTIKEFYSRAQSKWGISHREIKVAVEDLCRRKLLLKIDRRLLSLALREPVPDLPPPSENPGGFFILDMFQKNE